MTNGGSNTLFAPALLTLLNEVVNAASSFISAKDFAPMAPLASVAIALVVVNETKFAYALPHFITIVDSVSCASFTNRGR